MVWSRETNYTWMQEREAWFMQAERTCAVAPCISYLWQTGAWLACANGKSTRSMQCIDSHGGNATDEVMCSVAV